jgi:hypothetical protein
MFYFQLGVSYFSVVHIHLLREIKVFTIKSAVLLLCALEIFLTIQFNSPLKYILGHCQGLFT